MPMPAFPVELTDEIIAWIPSVCSSGEEYPTFLRCSLVCRAWLPASRHRLFQELAINSAERYDLLVSRVLHSEKMRVYLPSVRRLYLGWNKGPLRGRAFTLEFAGHLPNVTSMTITQKGEAFMLHPSSSLAMSRFSSVQELYIVQCEFPSFGALRRTLTFLPSLTNLEIHAPFWPAPTADLPPGLSHGAHTVARPALSTLQIGSWSTNPRGQQRAQQFVGWLSETATSSSLLSMTMWDVHPMATLGPSLLRIVRGVRKLYMNVDDDDTEYERFLSGALSIETLHLLIRLRIHADTWVQIERLVQALPHPERLAELLIAFAYKYNSNPFEHSKLDSLETLDAALRVERFCALKAVKFVMRISAGGPDWEEEGASLKDALRVEFRNKLPNLFARGIVDLDIRVYKDPDPPVAPESDTASSSQA